MPFSQRNLYYLRASPHVVLQTILYVDPSNLRWMNAPLYADDDQEEIDLTSSRASNEHATTGEDAWARALDHLRGKIMPKLRKEAVEGGLLSSSNNKGTVDYHVDVDFQMAYFFRATSGRHAVLLKDKQLIFPQMEMPPPALPASATRNRRENVLPPSRLAERQMQEDEESNVVAGGGATAADDEAGAEEQSSRRKRQRSPTAIRVKEEDDPYDVQLVPAEQGMTAEEQQEPSIDVDQLEDDKKPRLHVSYSGFQIFGKSLILVVEPTKRTKRYRPLLFRAKAPVERHQLSATPFPDDERATPAPVLDRASSRHQDTRARSTRSISIASSFDEPDVDDERASETPRADSRRHADRNSQRLFRGTPSDFDPTPTPTPAPEPRQSGGNGVESNDALDDEADEDDDEDDMKGSASMMLATQMMETDSSVRQGNDPDDEQ